MSVFTMDYGLSRNLNPEFVLIEKFGSKGRKFTIDGNPGFYCAFIHKKMFSFEKFQTEFSN